MKRTLLLATLLITLLFANSADAQPVVGEVTKFIPKPDLGLKIGANFNQLSGGESFQKAYKPGILFGAFGGVHWKKFGFRVEAMINSASYTYTYSSTQNGTFKNLYLDIPVLFEYKLIPRLWLQIGPQFSDVMSVKNPDVDNPKQYFKSNDLSGVLGLEARLPIHLVAGARYILGLSNINNGSLATASGTASNTWNTRTIQLYVGFRFL